MKSTNKSITGLWIIMTLLALLVFVGCRAFSPETPRVNKPPETFIVGAPVEHGGGYYHFHLYWLGTDADGRIEKFVWAITDTTIQDDLTSEDEEDKRFNPALDASTLAIANWTTRTDSIFDFAIHQGTLTSADMTFHIVAMDDFGDYDRSPARLHFFSNTLGSPDLRFFRVEEDGNWTPINRDNFDVVGFQRPYTLAWAGSTPNIRGYDLEALAEIDTVPPFTDGLLGYKWQLNGDLGGNCVPSITDCWHPRKYVEAIGDSVSFFGIGTQLNFANDNSGIGPFKEMLESGTYNMQVNSIDVAGVEVAHFMRTFQLQVNFDPETIILDGVVDDKHPNASDADQVYPYYVLLKEIAAGIDPVKHSFSSGERIPDRTYVVFKALGRDNPEDIIQDQSYTMGMTGYVDGAITKSNTSVFGFTTQASPVNYTPPEEWAATEENEGWMADTLGFLVGPRTEFTMNMQSEDEHGRRDNTPAQLSFFVGYPPCLQGIELLLPDDVSAFDEDLACYEPGDEGHPCMDGAVTKFAITHGSGDMGEFPDREYLPYMALYPVTYVVNPVTLEVKAVDNADDPAYDTFGKTSAMAFRFKALIHGQDEEDEQYLNPLFRMLGINFQVDYENDPYNRITDCWGPDQINIPVGGTRVTSPTQTENNWDQVRNNPANLQLINPTSGTWELRINIAVPAELFEWGPGMYKTIFIGTGAGSGLFADPIFDGYDIELDDADRDFIFNQMIIQYGAGSVSALVMDQGSDSGLAYPRSRPVKYRYFDGVRPPAITFSGNQTWRHDFLDIASTDLSLFEMFSVSGPSAEGSIIPTKLFNVVVHGTDRFGVDWQFPPVVESNDNGNN